MTIVGLYLVRNEVDIVEVNIRHHLARVIDEALVVDNGSTDGTLELLLELARDLPITVASEPGHYDQAGLVTRMARQAARRGASWLLPIDADEFWTGTTKDLRDTLTNCPDEVGLLRCEVVNLVQHREELAPSESSLLTMTMRAAEPRGYGFDAEKLVEAGEIAFVEMVYPSKCISRGSPDIAIGRGNHSVEGVTGEECGTDEIVCLHAPLRARSILTTKLDQGRRVLELADVGHDYWHVKRWWRLAREGRINEEWAANSYKDGALGIGGDCHALVRDERLRDIIDPFVKDSRRTSFAAFQRLDPAIGAYMLALPTIPGWFSECDLRLMVEIDRLQGKAGISGDLLEIGTYMGKSAILLGYLCRPGERLVVCDLFDAEENIGAENPQYMARWYSGLSRKGFESNYLRFHEQLPDMIVGPSADIDCKGLEGSCRIVHIDGSHVYANVRGDIATARAILGHEGIMILDDISTQHNPGSALAAWEAVGRGELEPICLTDAKLYATVGTRGQYWREALRGWSDSQPDLAIEMHELVGFQVPRVVSKSARFEPGSSDQDDRTKLVSLEPLYEEEAEPPVSQPTVERDEVLQAWAQVDILRQEIDALRSSKTFRYTDGVRRVYGYLRGAIEHLQGGSK